jgi:hypothetical protein
VLLSEHPQRAGNGRNQLGDDMSVPPRPEWGLASMASVAAAGDAAGIKRPREERRMAVTPLTHCAVSAWR